MQGVASEPAARRCAEVPPLPFVAPACLPVGRRPAGSLAVESCSGRLLLLFRRASLPLLLQPQRRPSPGSSPVHTQPFAFRAPQEDDESVKMSNPARNRSSASDHASSLVMLPALSDFREGSPAPLLQAGRRISPAFFYALDLPKRRFLFDTNESFSCTVNFATRTKQSTSNFLFDTNETSRSTNHKSLITTHQPGAQIFHG